MSWRDIRSEEHKQVPRKYDLTLRLLSFTELQILNLRVNVCCTFLRMQLDATEPPRYICDEGETRTLNRQIRNLLLYPLSYFAIILIRL